MKRLTTLFQLLLYFVMSNVGVHTVCAQWIQQRSGVRTTLNDIVMLDSLTAVAAGDAGTILKTTNAGETWRRALVVPGILPAPDWKAVAFGTTTLGAVVGSGAAGAMTTDGGNTWFNLFNVAIPLPVNELRSVAFAGPTTIFVGSASGHLLTTSDRGLTWRIQNFGGYELNDILFPRVLQDSITTSFGYIITPRLAFQTTDRGVTWRPQQLPVLGLGYARRGDIAENGNMAYAVGADGDFTTVPTILMKAQTDTSWRRWLYMPPTSVGVMNDVSAPAPQVAFACGRALSAANIFGQGMVFKTTNAGQFWSAQYGFRRGLNAIGFFNDRRGFAVGDSGSIFFTAKGGGSVIHAFRLLTPGDGDTLRVGTTFRFRWERASDLQPDTAWYQLFTSTTGPDGPWTYRSGTMDTVTGPQTAASQGEYWWMVRASDGMNSTACEAIFSFATQTTLDVGLGEQIHEFLLYQNYPNPFNPTTIINYQIPSTNHVTLNLFDVLGCKVATLIDEWQSAGFKEVEFNADNLASGVYLYRLETAGHIATKKLVVLK